MRRVELSGFLAGVCREVGNQIFIDETEHIIVLPAIHGDIFDQVQQITDSLGTSIGGFTQLGKPGLQRLEDVGKAVERISKPGDVILFLGAGDITHQAHQYADVLRKGKIVNE